MVKGVTFSHHITPDYLDQTNPTYLPKALKELRLNAGRR